MGSNPTPRTIDVIRSSSEQRILDHAFWLKKEGYRESTIVSRVKSLRGLARKADLSNPEAVKVALSSLSVSEGRKENLVNVYGLFCGQNNIPFTAPRYHRVEKLPFIPLETEVDQLIAGMGKKHATYLQGLKELGCRAGELWNLKWEDMDLEARSVNITPEKNSLPPTTQDFQQTGWQAEQSPKERKPSLWWWQPGHLCKVVLHAKSRAS